MTSDKINEICGQQLIFTGNQNNQKNRLRENLYYSVLTACRPGDKATRPSRWSLPSFLSSESAEASDRCSDPGDNLAEPHDWC